MKFPELLAEHLLAASAEGRSAILAGLTTRIKDALDFLPLFLACLVNQAEKTEFIPDFWGMWAVLAEALKPVTVKAADRRLDRLHYGDEIQAIRSLMFGGTPWQGVPNEQADMLCGKTHVLGFCRETVIHPLVADDLARLLHYFPDVFVPDGLFLLADCERKAGDGRILVGTNTVYYLEKVIQRILIKHHPLVSKPLQAACLTLLDAMVETGSSAAYFMRERLVSRRVVGAAYPKSGGG